MLEKGVERPLPDNNKMTAHIAKRQLRVISSEVVAFTVTYTLWYV
jgi:hypothetical protein